MQPKGSLTPITDGSLNDRPFKKKRNTVRKTVWQETTNENNQLPKITGYKYVSAQPETLQV